MQYDSNFYQNSAAYKKSSRQSSRDRGTARAPEPLKFVQPQKPIDEALHSALGQVDTAGVHPDLIAQITQSVINQLRTSVDAGTPIHVAHPTKTNACPPPPPVAPVPKTPSVHSDASPPMPRNVYTPPSPQKHSDYHEHSSPEVRPTVLKDIEVSPKDINFDDDRTPSRSSMRSDTLPARPKIATRTSTLKQETMLEKYWGELFDIDGRATARLGQFLRGVAVHLVSEYKSLHISLLTLLRLSASSPRTVLSLPLSRWQSSTSM
jgi:hypothetical protein